jgi:hypothetical protein
MNAPMYVTKYLRHESRRRPRHREILLRAANGPTEVNLIAETRVFGHGGLWMYN